jgi:hypothetical protein
MKEYYLKKQEEADEEGMEDEEMEIDEGLGDYDVEDDIISEGEIEEDQEVASDDMDIE